MLPTTADDVTIAVGRTIILDVAAGFAKNVAVYGTLVADPLLSVWLTAADINVEAGGFFDVSNGGAAYTAGVARFTLYGTETSKAARFVPSNVTAVGSTGTLKRLATIAGGFAVNETITVTFSSATAFTVSGSISGALGAGTVGTAFNNKVYFVATGTFASTNTRTFTVTERAFTNGLHGRSVHVHDYGRIRCIGNPPAVTRTTIAAHVAAAATSLTLADSVVWAINDKVVLGPTDFYGTAQGASELLTLSAAASGTTCPVSAVTAARYGVLQYATDTGMSLTAGTLTNSQALPTATWDAIPKVLDERAPVINLTRNIIFEGANDTAWTTDKFGMHMMFMGNNCRVELDGVEIRRCGQAGRIGRYPLHWHMNSYESAAGPTIPSDGTFLGAFAAGTNYAKNCSIWDSQSRMVSLHGCHGVEFTNNVGFDILGHAVIFEDGSEKANTVTGNWVIKVRDPVNANVLLLHDSEALSNGGLGASSGFWLSNPYNTVSGNRACDTPGVGIWNAFAERCFGLSQEVAEVPRTTPILVHADNQGHANGDTGMKTLLFPSDDIGTLMDLPYAPAGEFTISGAKLWKNMRGGYENRVKLALYRGWTQADNEGQDFFGAASATNPVSKGDRLLCIGESLNNATSRTAPVVGVRSPRAAFASYHELLSFQDSIVVNYPHIAPVFHDVNRAMTGGGMVFLQDLYTDPMFTFKYFTGIKLVNSDGGARIKSPHIDGNALNAERNYTLAGVIRDDNGLFTTAGHYWLQDHPFLTFNCTGLILPAEGGQSTPDQFYGCTPNGANFDSVAYNYDAAMTVERLDTANVIQGTWAVATSTGFGFRHFGAKKGGRYWVKRPAFTANVHVNLGIDFGAASTDTFLVAMQWDAATVGQVFTTAREVAGSAPVDPTTNGDVTAGTARVCTSVASIALVEAGAGDKYFFDSANTRVWVKYVGGLTPVGGTWAGTIAEIDFKRHTIAIKV